MTRPTGLRADRARVEPVPLVQREDALGLCDRAFAAMAAHGALILVEGGPGAGKSAVLDAAVALAESRKVQVLRAAGSEFERDFRYGVVRQLFRSRVARTKRDPLAPLGLDQPSAERPEHAVNQALLDLLSRTATARPVLLAIDDLALA